MAYGGASDNAEMLGSTVRRSFDGSGRSRRTEVVYWCFATALVSIVLGFTAGILLPRKAGIIVDDLLRVPIMVPTFALFVRRLHDQDRSGWWSLLLPISILLGLPDMIRWVVDDPQTVLAYKATGPHALRWAAEVASIATLILMFLPGTVGPNRYGGDPRESGDTAVA